MEFREHNMSEEEIARDIFIFPTISLIIKARTKNSAILIEKIAKKQAAIKPNVIRSLAHGQ